MTVQAKRRGWVGADGVGRLPLTRGQVALVDAAAVEELSQWNWQAVPTGFGGFYAKRGGQRQKHIYLHRDIMGAGAGQEVDHRNRDGLDNRRENLRLTASNGNKHNRGMLRNNRSGVKGVHYQPHRRKWRAAIGINKRRVELGRFDSKAEAVAAYDRAARQYHGEFALTNEDLTAART